MRLAARVLAASAMLSALLIGGAGGARAASFAVIDLPNGGGRGIVLAGMINYGDDAAFRAAAATLSEATMVTTGPGGSVAAAMAIGSYVHNHGWRTLVPARVSCASACALIWLAGSRLEMGAGAQVGLHAMSITQQGQRSEVHDWDSVLRNWLTQLGYAWDTTATIVNTHAASIRWYDMIELNANGIPAKNYP